MSIHRLQLTDDAVSRMCCRLGACSRGGRAATEPFTLYFDQNIETIQMEDEKSEMAQEAIFEIIENQMRDNTPPITKKTYTRLKSIGHSHEDAMKLIRLCPFGRAI